MSPRSSSRSELDRIRPLERLTLDAAVELLEIGAQRREGGLESLSLGAPAPAGPLRDSPARAHADVGEGAVLARGVLNDLDPVFAVGHSPGVVNFVYRADARDATGTLEVNLRPVHVASQYGQ